MKYSQPKYWLALLILTPLLLIAAALDGVFGECKGCDLCDGKGR